MRMTKAKTFRPAKTDVRGRQPTDNNGGTPQPPWRTSAEFQPLPQHMMTRKMNHRPPHPGQKGRGVLWRGKSRPQNCLRVKSSARPSLPMRWTTTRRRGWQTTRDKLLEEQPQTKCKNKQPLSGVPNFKNRPLLPISADDLDDDQLGITQRTPPHHHNSRNRPADTVLHISQNSEDGTQEAGPSVQAPKEKKNKHKKRKWEASPPGRGTPADSFARKETQGKEKKAQTPSSISGKSGRARTASTPS